MNRPARSPARRTAAAALRALAAGACAPTESAHTASAAQAVVGPSLGAPAAPSGATYDFVFDNLAIDPGSASTMAGFDLDGAFSAKGDAAGCAFADALSDLDPDQNEDLGTGAPPCTVGGKCQGGVDNVLPFYADAVDSLAGSSAAQTRNQLATQLAGGHIVWLLRLSNVTSLANATGITLALYRGWSDDKSCSTLFGGSGTFVVANDSLLTPGDLGTPRWSTTASIVNYRLQARFGTHTTLTAEAPVTLGGFFGAPDATPLPIYQLQVRATLDPNGTAATSGNLGGWALGTELLASWVSLTPMLATFYNAGVPQLSDLQYGGQCGGSYGAPVAGVGLGLRFGLARATLVGTASSAPAGLCGSP